jgi:polyisoprenoid-binding protein YceI
VKVSFRDIDPAHTLVQFGMRHMMISTVRGHFTTVAGTVQVDEHDLAAFECRSDNRREFD